MIDQFEHAIHQNVWNWKKISVLKPDFKESIKASEYCYFFNVVGCRRHVFFRECNSGWWMAFNAKSNAMSIYTSNKVSFIFPLIFIFVFHIFLVSLISFLNDAYSWFIDPSSVIFLTCSSKTFDFLFAQLSRLCDFRIYSYYNMHWYFTCIV